MTVSGYADAARLVDSTGLRGMVLALRGNVGEFGPPDEPDPALVEPVARPFESVSDVSGRLLELEGRLRAREDRRAVFLTVYSRMTRAVQDGIERGRFGNPDWMRDYLIAFAEYYRRAFLAFERGAVGAVPDPWRVAFGTALRGDALVVQDAALGVNAHINYDLALAIDDVGIDPNRAGKYADHRAIDGILARLIDAQQEALVELYGSGIDDVDAALGRLDETLTLFSMTEGREQAWRIAVVLTDVDLPPVASYARWVLRATATGGAFFILGPRLDPQLYRALRTAESREADVGTILARLADRLDAEQ